MIPNVEISGAGGYEPDDNVKKYMNKQVGRLDRFVPRHMRKSMHAHVVASEVNQANGNKYLVEATVVVPDKTFHASDSTINVLAATDIVEAKLAAQLRKYKQEKKSYVGRHRFLTKLKRDTKNAE